MYNLYNTLYGIKRASCGGLYLNESNLIFNTISRSNCEQTYLWKDQLQIQQRCCEKIFLFNNYLATCSNEGCLTDKHIWRNIGILTPDIAQCSRGLISNWNKTCGQESSLEISELTGLMKPSMLSPRVCECTKRDLKSRFAPHVRI